ncbi:helix-turn-helix domain-containing protein [Devosia sp.]|uniref:helix-turn-helix domain-containing protein n=1 Tax=Devosia sp. TaxID=1871048 RepID=UPI0027331371|nr:helix-turn-helix domain-containing protein [Devosia sp.]MDP2779487.1 helix-turn-helix domain-containing protein [Devosia sp.]
MASLKAMRSLSVLGQNLRQARLARRFTMAELAMRADVSERTLMRLEKGDPGIGIGNLASVLAALGSPAILAGLMAPENDAVGLSLALQAVPKRGRSFSSGKSVQTRDEASEQQDNPESKRNARKGIAF